MNAIAAIHMTTDFRLIEVLFFQTALVSDRRTMSSSAPLNSGATNFTLGPHAAVDTCKPRDLFVLLRPNPGSGLATRLGVRHRTLALLTLSRDQRFASLFAAQRAGRKTWFMNHAWSGIWIWIVPWIVWSTIDS